MGVTYFFPFPLVLGHRQVVFLEGAGKKMSAVILGDEIEVTYFSGV
jgi:hypothetical protein